MQMILPERRMMMTDSWNYNSDYTYGQNFKQNGLQQQGRHYTGDTVKRSFTDKIQQQYPIDRFANYDTLTREQFESIKEQ